MSEQLYFTINAGLAKRGTPVLDSQPGAHTGATRKYIPGYSDANIVFWNDATGNDGNTGASIAQAVETYAQAATLAGSTKKIRKVNSSTVSVSITKPTEATIGTTSTIASSLTAPVATWTAAGTPSFGSTGINGVAWAPWLSKFFAVADAGKIGHSSDGNVWTQVASPGFSTSNIKCIAKSDSLKIMCAASEGGKIAHSSDGVTWDQVPIIPQIGTNTIYGLCWADSLSKFIAVGDLGIILLSEDGETWTAATSSMATSDAIFSVAASPDYVVAVGAATLLRSAEGEIWDAASNPGTTPFALLGVTYSETVGKFVAVGNSTSIRFSTDGDVWTEAGTIGFASGGITSVSFHEEIQKYVATGDAGAIGYSGDGNIWTLAGTPGFGGDEIYGNAYSSLLGIGVCVGNTGRIVKSTAFASTISAHVAGFTIQAMQYSGTVTAYNCSLRQPGTSAALSLDNCRVEYDSHISNNAVTSRATLYRGDRHTTGAPASQDAISMTRDTVAGVWYIYNSSATGYEEIKDNIIEGGIVSSYAVKVTSGNTRGTSSGAVFSDECTQSDPKFVDETDYKLQREMDSYQYDSPLVAASQFYFNANGDARDLGAWSYNESTMEMLYTRHFPFLLPTGKDSFSNVLHSRVNRHVGEDGTPDVINDIDALWEEITLRYQTLPTDHIDFLDWWQGNFSDMTCEIDFFVGQPVSSTITVNGAHSAGDVTLTIDAGTTLAAGDRIFSGTEVYSVLYMVDDTLAVLSRKLAAGISDNAILTISQPTGKGTYQYLPQADRDLRKPMGQAASEFDRGLVLNFSRKRV